MSERSPGKQTKRPDCVTLADTSRLAFILIWMQIKVSSVNLKCNMKYYRLKDDFQKPASIWENKIKQIPKVRDLCKLVFHP